MNDRDPEIDSTPQYPQPPQSLIEAAALAIPKVLANVHPEHDGTIGTVASLLARKLREVGHTLAAAHWAIHDYIRSGKLKPATITIHLPSRGRRVGRSIGHLYGQPRTRQMEWSGGEEVTTAIPKGRPASFDVFRVIATDQLWLSWKESDVAPIIPSTDRVIVSGSLSEEHSKRFQIALSFPGERRCFVEQVASRLANHLGRDHILYDKFYEAEFARPNLDVYLQNLYHDESELIAVFLCEEYEQKEWCGLEWRAIRNVIKKRRASSVMPLRFDTTEVPGLFSTDGYVWIGDRPPDQIADLILERSQMEMSETSQ